MGSSFYTNTTALPAGIYLLKVNNKNTRTRCEICSKLTIKTPKRRLTKIHVFFYKKPVYKKLEGGAP